MTANNYWLMILTMVISGITRKHLVRLLD